MRKHRERTVALLLEKDNEITALRLHVPLDPLTLSPVAQRMDEAGAASGSESIEDEDRAASLTAIHKLLARETSPSSGLLHFKQELGRRDVEIATLRRAKHELEVSVRELQQSRAMSAHEWEERCSRLEEQIRKDVRDRSRESANLEYLKNVVYRYMICTDISGRLQIAKAIATILEFSPAEKREAIASLNKGWWPVTKI